MVTEQRFLISFDCPKESMPSILCRLHLFSSSQFLVFLTILNGRAKHTVVLSTAALEWFDKLIEQRVELHVSNIYASLQYAIS